MVTNQLKKFSWVLFGLILIPGIGQSATILYPGPAPCNSTLQACINGADSGDVIQTATFYIDESINITKSLTLMPAPGFSGVFLGGSATPHYLSINDSPDDETLKIVIDQVVLQPGAISISLNSGSGHDILIRNSLITSTLGSTATRGVYTDIRTSASITVEKTLIQGHGYGINFFSLSEPNEVIYFKAIGNRITGNSSIFSTTGIDVDLRGEGYANATVLSNAIWETSNCNCGGASGIYVHSSDTGTAVVRVLNNTLDQIDSIGLFNGAAPVGGNRQTYFYNNIVTNSLSGFYAPPYSQNLAISHNYNDFYGNGNSQYNGYPPGAQTYTFNPLNSDQGYGNFQLQSNSPAINAGSAAFLPDGSIYDAVQKPRVIGTNVDLGAFESTYADGSEYMLLEEIFGQIVLPSQYSYVKGIWELDGTNIIGFSEKKAAFLASPAFTSCSLCQFETTFQTAGDEVPGKASRLWIQAWHQDKNNLVDVIVKEKSNKLILRQKVGGKIVSKASVGAVIDPFVEYRMKLIFDGQNILLFLDGVQLLTVPAVGNPSGTFGFQAKATHGYLSNIFVHY